MASYAGPYNAIHVGAAAPTLPAALVDQLACPGRMFIPIGTYAQYIWQIDKDVDGKVTKEQVMGVSVSHSRSCVHQSTDDGYSLFPQYVPLTDRPT